MRHFSNVSLPGSSGIPLKRGLHFDVSSQAGRYIQSEGKHQLIAHIKACTPRNMGSAYSNKSRIITLGESYAPELILDRLS